MNATRSVLHVLAPAPFGGLERVVQILATRQCAAGTRASVAAIVDPELPEPWLLAALRSAGVPVHPIAFGRRAYVEQIRALRALAVQLQPDVIHSHGYIADVFVGLSRSTLSRPIIATVHGFTGGGIKNRLYEWLQRRSYRFFDAVVAVSALLARQLVDGGLTGRRVSVIRNAFSASGDAMEAEAARSELGVPEGAFSIGWIGRVSHEKGLDVLVDALSDLSAIHWHATVLGDGREVGVLQDRVASRELAERVVWRGAVPNAARYLKGFDVLVISSRTEGTPMTLLEAMAGQVPIVATSVGGIPDVVSTEEAMLVAPEAPARLAAALLHVYGDPINAALRSGRALERLHRDCTPEKFLEQYDRLYDTICTHWSDTRQRNRPEHPSPIRGNE